MHNTRHKFNHTKLLNIHIHIKVNNYNYMHIHTNVDYIPRLVVNIDMCLAEILYKYAFIVYYYSIFPVDNDPHFIVHVDGISDAICFNVDGPPGLIYQLLHDKVSGKPIYIYILIVQYVK